MRPQGGSFPTRSAVAIGRIESVRIAFVIDGLGIHRCTDSSSVERIGTMRPTEWPAHAGIEPTRTGRDPRRIAL
jgi:hypothetical protein